MDFDDTLRTCRQRKVAPPGSALPAWISSSLIIRQVSGKNCAAPSRLRPCRIGLINEETLTLLLDPPLSTEAEVLSALLRRLPLVEPFPARGPGAANLRETARLALRTRMKA
jgi:hypothetical protein